MSVKTKIAAAFGFVGGVLFGGLLWAQQQPEPGAAPGGSTSEGAAPPPGGGQSGSAGGAVRYVPAAAPVEHPLPPPRLKIGMVGMSRFVVAMTLFAVVSTALGIAGMKHNDKAQARQDAIALTGGDPDRGKTAIEQFGCASCHTIPGIHGATAQVGPPLSAIANRNYVAGVIANTPENLQKWILNPPAIDPMTAMPNLHVSEQNARDIACYLYTLR